LQSFERPLSGEIPALDKWRLLAASRRMAICLISDPSATVRLPPEQSVREAGADIQSLLFRISVV